jgi:hypothetical protein
MNEENGRPAKNGRTPTISSSSLPPASDKWTPAKGARLRRAAASRMAPLPGHRCGTTDPWICRCEPEPEIIEIDYAACGLTEGLENYAPARDWGAAA